MERYCTDFIYNGKECGDLKTEDDKIFFEYLGKCIEGNLWRL